MKLTSADRPWAPENHPEYLCLLKAGGRPPSSQEEFLLKQVSLLQRLVLEESPEVVAAANRRLQDNLPEEFQVWLPHDPLASPKGVRQLLFNPAVLGSPLEVWKEDVRDCLNLPPMPAQEALEEAQGLDLESYLARLM